MQGSETDVDEGAVVVSEVRALCSVGSSGLGGVLNIAMLGGVLHPEPCTYPDPSSASTTPESCMA